MTPIVQGETLVYRQDGQEQVLTVDTAAWFAWLETASTFSFVSEEGSFTARREQAGHKRGGWYWKAYRKQHGKLSSRYLGKSETITLARLQTVAQALADALVETMPDADAYAAVPSAQAAAPGMRSDLLIPLLATKLHRPLPRAQLVRRPQLAERLTQGVKGPLTLVSAPAGFGKTTLLAQWLADSGMPVAWLSLETQDNEPVRFFSYLVAALQTLDPGIGTSALELLQTPQPAALESVLTLYRGLPYNLPLGIHLYTKSYASSVPARAVPPRQRDHVLQHKLRTKTDASGLMRQLERTYVER